MKDEFMIVSGMPERNGDRHVSEIASMALDLLAGIDTTSAKLDNLNEYVNIAIEVTESAAVKEEQALNKGKVKKKPKN